jgi:hypothetical protein
MAHEIVCFWSFAVFNYAKGMHTVAEVSAAEYMACTATKPLGSDSSGATTVPLKTPGSHYFICSIPGHCSAGMKLSVTVGGSSTPAPVTPTTPTGSSPNTNPPYTTTPATGTPTTNPPYTTTPTTPGMTPFTSYNPSASGLGSAGLAGLGLVWFVVVQLALFA